MITSCWLFATFQNNSIKEIAEIRKLTPQTIYGHFAKLIEAGQVQLSDVLPQDKIEELNSNSNSQIDDLKEKSRKDMDDMKKRLEANLSQVMKNNNMLQIENRRLIKDLEVKNQKLEKQIKSAVQNGFISE